MNNESRPPSPHPISSVDVDATFRSMMATAVAAAPPAPTVDDIAHPRLPLPAAVDTRRRPWIGAGVGLVAAAATISALVVVAQRDTPTNRDNPPADATLPSARLRGLPEHVLPTVVPAGWRLADIAEAPFSPGITTQLGGQLFRRTDDGAAVALYIAPIVNTDSPPDDPTTETTAVVGASENTDRASVEFADGQAHFTELGANVDVQRAGLSDAEAAAFLSTLTASGSGAQLVYRSTDPAWVQEASSSYAGPAPDRRPYGVLVYRSDEGDHLFISLMETTPRNEMWRFGVPEQRGDATLYLADSTVSRGIGSVVASASFDRARAQTNVGEAARSLVASLELVPAAAWTDAEDELAARYSALPAEDQMGTDGVTITRHRDADDDAICASNGAGLTRCHRNSANDWGLGSLDGLRVDMNLDGTWVHVSGLSSGPPDRVDAVTDQGERPGPGVVDTVGGYLVLVVAPDAATTMTLSVGGPQSVVTEAVRPIR